MIEVIFEMADSILQKKEIFPFDSSYWIQKFEASGKYSSIIWNPIIEITEQCIDYLIDSKSKKPNFDGVIAILIGKKHPYIFFDEDCYSIYLIWIYTFFIYFKLTVIPPDPPSAVYFKKAFDLFLIHSEVESIVVKNFLGKQNLLL